MRSRNIHIIGVQRYIKRRLSRVDEIASQSNGCFFVCLLLLKPASFKDLLIVRDITVCRQTFYSLFSLALVVFLFLGTEGLKKHWQEDPVPCDICHHRRLSVPCFECRRRHTKNHHKKPPSTASHNKFQRSSTFQSRDYRIRK